MKTRFAAGIVVPELNSVPAYAALAEQLKDLEQRRDALEAEKARLVRKRLSEADLQPADDRAQRVARVLGDPVPPTTEGERERFDRVLVELSDMEAAIELLGQRIYVAKIAASAEICELVRGDHDRLAKDVIHALRTLHEAVTAYTAFSDQMRNKGINWGKLRPLSILDMIGRPEYRGSDLAYFFREVVNDGHISKSEMPEAYR